MESRRVDKAFEIQSREFEQFKQRQLAERQRKAEYSKGKGKNKWYSVIEERGYSYKVKIQAIQYRKLISQKYHVESDRKERLNVFTRFTFSVFKNGFDIMSANVGGRTSKWCDQKIGQVKSKKMFVNCARYMGIPYSILKKDYIDIRYEDMVDLILAAREFFFCCVHNSLDINNWVKRFLIYALVKIKSESEFDISSYKAQMLSRHVKVCGEFMLNTPQFTEGEFYSRWQKRFLRDPRYVQQIQVYHLLESMKQKKPQKDMAQEYLIRVHDDALFIKEHQDEELKNCEVKHKLLTSSVLLGLEVDNEVQSVGEKEGKESSSVYSEQKYSPSSVIISLPSTEFAMKIMTTTSKTIQKRKYDMEVGYQHHMSLKYTKYQFQNEEPILCPVCCISFEDILYLADHIQAAQVKHSQKLDVICICGQHYSGWYTWSEHIEHCEALGSEESGDDLETDRDEESQDLVPLDGFCKYDQGGIYAEIKKQPIVPSIGQEDLWVTFFSKSYALALRQSVASPTDLLKIRTKFRFIRDFEDVDLPGEIAVVAYDRWNRGPFYVFVKIDSMLGSDIDKLVTMSASGSNWRFFPFCMSVAFRGVLCSCVLCLNCLDYAGDFKKMLLEDNS